ncbi:MAG: hypothetical protein ACXVZL_07745 [Gaiellaceae bacterium]
MDVILAFGAALLALRLAGALARRWRASRRPALAAWAASLGCYAVASAALAWGAAHGWDARAFRVYYLCGGLLTAPLLGAGSLLLQGRRWAAPVALLWAGFAAGIAVSVHVHGAFGGTAIPAAQDHLSFFPARLAAIAANSLGTLAVVAVALASARRRPLGNALILAGVGVAAAGSAVAGLGVARTAAFFALAVVLLYGGFVVPGTASPAVHFRRCVARFRSLPSRLSA